MKTLKLQDGDLVLVNGEFQVVEGDEELAQAVRIELSTYKNEWFLDAQMGVDYYGKVLVKQPNEEEIRTELVQAILREPRMRSVDTLNILIDRRQRKLSVSFQATARDGSTLVMEEVLTGAG